MSRLLFDQVGERMFEAGVSEGVLFTYTASTANTGVAWNGLTSVADSPDGGDANDQYADNIKYLSLRGTENRNGTIEAFTYPPQFNQCMGNFGANGVYFAGQTKKPFSFAYKTKVGNDVDGLDGHDKLHIVYNATVNPTEKTYETVNESPEAMQLSWEYTTTPLAVSLTTAQKTALADTDFAELAKIKSVAVFEIERTTESAAIYDIIEASIYGTDAAGEVQGTNSTLMLPADIIATIIANLPQN